MSEDTGRPDMKRLRRLLAERDALRAEGKDSPRTPAERLARAVTGRPDPAVTCEQAQTRLPECVAYLLRGAGMPQDLAAAARHAESCPDCGPLLADLLAAEEQLAPASPSAPDLAGLRRRRALHRFQEFVRDTVRAILSLRRPELLPGLDDLAGIIFAQAGASGRLRGPLALQTQGALGPGAGELSEAGLFLTATYLALQRLAEAAPPASSSRLREQTDLGWSTYEAAVESARAAGLNPDQSTFFVEAFTSQMARSGRSLPPLP